MFWNWFGIESLHCFENILVITLQTATHEMKAWSCVFKLFFVNLEATQLIETAIEMQ